MSQSGCIAGLQAVGPGRAPQAVCLQASVFTPEGVAQGTHESQGNGQVASFNTLQLRKSISLKFFKLTSRKRVGELRANVAVSLN